MQCEVSLNRAQPQLPSLQHFTFARFCFTLRTNTVPRLPEFSGSALRSGFGMALKNPIYYLNRQSKKVKT